VNGIGVTLARPEELLDEARSILRTGLGGHTACAINVHTFVEGCRARPYREALNASSFAFVDGVPIRWLLRAAGHPAPPRIHGADLMDYFLQNLSDARHLFFGSTPETLSFLEAHLRLRFPGLRIAGFISPPFRPAAVREDARTIDRINGTEADVLWVGLGAPKQEAWMNLNAGRLSVPLCVGVGAAFEILAGNFSRAPKPLQHLGLEWTWRLLQDPARLWRRYLSTNGFFLMLLIREATRRLFHRAPQDPS